jgi:hypothetical protein
VETAVCFGLHRLLNSDRHLARFAITETNVPVTVTHHCQSRKAKLTSTFYNLCDTIDGDQFLKEVVVAL